MAVDIESVEDGILTALRQDPVMRTYLKTIKSFEGDTDADLTQEPQLFPAAFTVFIRGDYRPLSNLSQEADFTFAVLLAAQSYLGNREARTGTITSVGTRQMLKDLRKLLVGNTLGFAIVPGEASFPPLLLVTEQALINRRSLSVYQAEYRTSYNVIPLGT